MNENKGDERVREQDTAEGILFKTTNKQIKERENKGN